MSNKTDTRLRRKYRIRAKIHGTAERPRLSVFRSSKHIYAQVINDATGHTIEQSIDLTRGSVLSSTDWNNRTVAPAFDGNDKTTVFGYDALGRFLGVRLPGESDANVIYNYSVTKTSPSMIATATRVNGRLSDGSKRGALTCRRARQSRAQTDTPHARSESHVAAPS